jgi:NhaA family Na+:H+ antiporter
MKKLYAPWEKAFEKVATPFERFLHAQTTTGLILVFTTIIALVLANSPLAEQYLHIFHSNIDIYINKLGISMSIHHWINDGLMAMFFFVIGLEIKRNILVGELSDIKVAMLPIISALGGMIMPALIYYSLNFDSAGAHGWGIPMATDIAFAISALVLLKNRVSTALVTFLVALAIVDDLGAVVVIALFYTEQIHMVYLGLAFASLFVMIMFNRFGIHAVIPYFTVGLIMWFFMLESGVHATIAGVIAAMAIPSRPKYAPVNFATHIKNQVDEYNSYPLQEDYRLHENQKAILDNIKKRITALSSPASRLEESMHLPVSLIVIPLFALANAGVSIDFSSAATEIANPVSFGIIAGLVIGKVLGIAGFALLSIKMGIAKLPHNSNISQLFGVSLLGGIGFTMSIFIAELAFVGNSELIFQAKIGILAASLTAGILGFVWLRFIAKKPEPHLL